MGVALAATPLVGQLNALAATGELRYSTGDTALDRELGGGMREGSFLAIVGPSKSGKSAFLTRLAMANGIPDAHPMNVPGGSDQLSIMKRPDGKHIGSLMLDGHQPWTDKERDAMATDENARHAFLARWFQRTRDVVRESGGLYALSVSHAIQNGDADPEWMRVPDYVIRIENRTASIRRMPT